MPGMSDYVAAAELRERIAAVKTELDGLYAQRAQLMAALAREMTTRDIAVLFGIKQPLVINTLNRLRWDGPRRPRPPEPDDHDA